MGGDRLTRESNQGRPKPYYYGRKGGTYNSEGADGVAFTMDDRREGTAVGTTVTGRYRTLHMNPTEREALGCSPYNRPHLTHHTFSHPPPHKTPQKDRGYTRSSVVVTP